MSCWTCETCGQKWCDLDDCPVCSVLEWDNPEWTSYHAHELINRREPEHYEKSTS